MTQPPLNPDEPQPDPLQPDPVPADLLPSGDATESEPDADTVPAPLPSAGRRRGERRSRVPGCLAMLVVLAVIAGGIFYAGHRAVNWIHDALGPAADYSGPGTGSTTIEVRSGDSAAAICRSLKAATVVASVDACVSAANANPDSSGIQVGYYQLKKKMKAADAIDYIVDPAHLVSTVVTIPEGLTVRQIVGVLADKTDFKAAAFNKVLAHPDGLGLPDYAEGNPEGYLFPATYSYGPKATPTDMLKAMVTRWRQAADDAGLESAASKLGYTANQLMTIASLVQAEGRGNYMPKIARVIYNRVETTGAPTYGLLQIDAAVNYALDQSPTTVLSQDQIDSVADSPYNTYKQPGLPPTPIEAPGDDAIEAAAHPASGNWLFYVTVNLRTGETKFTDSYDTFLTFKREFQNYCATQSDRC